jgi:hypothetical protein
MLTFKVLPYLKQPALVSRPTLDHSLSLIPLHSEQGFFKEGMPLRTRGSVLAVAV